MDNLELATPNEVLPPADAAACEQDATDAAACVGMTRGVWRTIARNSVSNWVGQFASIIVGFFLSPFLVYELGRNGYGIWAIIGSIGAYMSVLDLGIGSAVVRYVAKFRGGGEVEQTSKVVNTALAFFAAIGVVALAAGLVMASLFGRLFHIAAASTSSAQLAMALVSCEIAIAFPAGVFGALLIALQRYDITNGIGLVGLLIRTALIILLVQGGYGVAALAAASLFATLLGSALKILMSMRMSPGLRISLRLADRSALRLISSYGIYSFLAMAASRVIFSTDSLVIGAFMSAAAVTSYAIAWNLVSYVKNLIWGLANVLIPASSGMEARGGWEDIRHLLVRGTRLSLLVTLPITSALIILGKQFISLWMGPQYVSSAAVLTVLAISHTVYLSQSCAGSVLYGLGRHRRLALVACLEAGLNLGLSLLLLRRYGILGVALGTAIPQTFFHAVVIPAYALGVCRVSVRRYLLEGVAPPVLAAIPFVVCVSVLPGVLHPTSWARFAAVIALSLAAMGPGAAVVAGIAPRRRPPPGTVPAFGTKSGTVPEAAGDSPRGDSPSAPRAGR